MWLKSEEQKSLLWSLLIPYLLLLAPGSSSRTLSIIDTKSKAFKHLGNAASKLQSACCSSSLKLTELLLLLPEVVSKDVPLPDVPLPEVLLEEVPLPEVPPPEVLLVSLGLLQERGMPLSQSDTTTSTHSPSSVTPLRGGDGKRVHACRGDLHKM